MCGISLVLQTISIVEICLAASLIPLPSVFFPGTLVRFPPSLLGEKSDAAYTVGLETFTFTYHGSWSLKADTAVFR
jgi:hypothetical protein